MRMKQPEPWGSDSQDSCVRFGADCHVRLGADLLRHTWDPVVVAVLRGGPHRRGELLSAIGGISDKVLHESLARLIDRSLIQRTNTDGARYRLTELGQSFADGPVRTLAYWAWEHSSVLA